MSIAVLKVRSLFILGMIGLTLSTMSFDVFAQPSQSKAGTRGKSAGAKKKPAKGRYESTEELIHGPLANVTAITLSHDQVMFECPAEDDQCSKRKLIDVAVTAVDVEGIEYAYRISGGKVIGSGWKVVWDLSDVRPGTYTITAAASQPVPGTSKREFYGRTRTAIVVVK